MYTLLTPETQIIPILIGRKQATARKINKTNSKFKQGDRIKLLCNLKRDYITILEITNISYKTIKELNKEDLKKLDYKTKKQYKQEPFNKNIKPNEKKIIIEFKIIENNILNYCKTQPNNH